MANKTDMGIGAVIALLLAAYLVWIYQNLNNRPILLYLQQKLRFKSRLMFKKVPIRFLMIPSV